MSKQGRDGGAPKTPQFEEEAGDFVLVEEPRTPERPRNERALVSLEVAFATPMDAVRAYSENLGVGQLALSTNNTLRKGTEVTVRMRIPGGGAPLQACGKVTWSRPDAMGIAFTQLPGSEGERLRKLVMDHTSLVERVRRQFSRQVEQPVPARVSARRTLLVKLVDEVLSDVVAELLSARGYVAVSDPGPGSKPNVIVADLATAERMACNLRMVPIVMVNASGPNDLARARIPFVRARAFVPGPASATRVVQAVQQLFGGR